MVLKKLSTVYGVPDFTVNWPAFFLTERQQRVKIVDVTSDWVTLHGGLMTRLVAWYRLFIFLVLIDDLRLHLLTCQYITSQPGQLSLAIPPWVSAKAVMLCGWGVKAGMVREWVTGKTVWSLAITGHIWASLAISSSHNRALYKRPVSLTLSMHCGRNSGQGRLQSNAASNCCWRTGKLVW